MKRVLLSAVVAVGLGFTTLQASAAPNESILTDAQIQLKKKCDGCHGVDGNGLRATVPKLAGQHADYLYKQLRNFKASGVDPHGFDNPVYPTPADLVYVSAPEGELPARTNPIYFLAMNGMVLELEDTDMKALAVYFSQRKRKPAVSQQDEHANAIAERLYQRGDPARNLAPCGGCHGPNGAGLPAQFPRLSGQFASYTALQLKNFRAGYRNNDPNRMMRDVSYKLTEEEIAALADYIAGLH